MIIHSLAYFEGPFNVNFYRQVPVGIGHVLKGGIAQDAGIVDENIYASKLLNSSLNDHVTIFNAIIVCDGFPAGGFNLIYNNVGGLDTSAPS